MAVLFPSEFQLHYGVYLPKHEPEPFGYTDGDATERYIHQAILASSDRSTASFELESHIRDWPSLYHLSRRRANLLRPLDLDRCRNVLEIGCGCGAITRYLAETCGQVTAIEGSLRRIAIARDRCGGLTNVTFICANFDEVTFEPAYDLVTSIGVWEYAGVYGSASADPWGRFIHRMRAPLARGGRGLIAIENQFGLKYFGGEDEDHTGRAYEGLEGYYPGTRVRTFGRKTIQRYLANANLVARWYLPFPDYKLPKVLVDADPPHDVELAQWCDATASGRHFADSLVRPELERNGLLPDLANSFLIETADVSDGLPQRPWLVASVALHRARRFQTVTRLVRSSSGGYEVLKEPLLPAEHARTTGSVRQVLEPAPLVVGEKLSLQMLRACRLGGPAGRQQFQARVTEWHDFLLGHVIGRGAEEPRLPPDFVDGTPFNLLVTPDGLAFIDREWVDETGDVTVRWVLFRGLYWFRVEYASLLPARYGPGRFGRFLRDHTAAMGCEWTENELVRLAAREVAFQQAVLGEAAGNGEADLSAFMADVKGGPLNRRHLLSLGKRNARLALEGYHKVVRLGGRLISRGEGDA